MSSVVEICNMALGGIGVSHEINAIDEDSTQAEQCDRFFSQTRDACLRDIMPSFARRYVSLGLVEESPNDEWDFSYRYPSTCLRAIRLVVGDRRMTSRKPWVISSDSSGKLIFTDERDAVLVFIERIEDTEIYDPAFVEAFSWRLASKLAIPLSRSPQERDYAYKRYLIERAQAEAHEGNEGGSDDPLEAESISIRE